MRSILFCAAIWMTVIGVGQAAAQPYEYYEGLGDYRLMTKENSRHPCAKPGTKVDLASTDKYVFAPSGVSAPAFREGDTISVYLKSAMFSYIPESSWWSQKPKDHGQVAIVANVGQTVDEASVPGRSAIAGRVVYYSPDLYQKQTVNQSFGVVYGPRPYKNGALNFDVTVLELDQKNSDELLPDLLRTVATLGSSALAATSPVVQQALNAIGASIVAGAKSKDDVMAKYKLTLLPGPATSENVAIPVLSEGDLIVVRKGPRQEPVNWDKLCYDASRGVLTDNEGNTPGLGYMVFSIVKGTPGEDLTTHYLHLANLLEEVRQRQDSQLITTVRDSLNRLDAVASESKKRAELNAALQSLADVKTKIREIPANQLAGGVQVAMLHAIHKSKFDALKADVACAPYAASFQALLNATHLEGLVAQISTLCLKTRLAPNALTPQELLGNVDVLNCEMLGNKRMNLTRILASELGGKNDCMALN